MDLKKNSTSLVVVRQSFDWKKFLLNICQETEVYTTAFIAHPGRGNAIPRDKTVAIFKGYRKSIGNWDSLDINSMVLAVADTGKIELSSKIQKCSKINMDEDTYIQTAVFSAKEWAKDSASYNKFCLEAEKYCHDVITRYLGRIKAKEGFSKTAYPRRKRARELHEYIENAINNEKLVDFFDLISLVMEAGKLTFLIDEYFK